MAGKDEREVARARAGSVVHAGRHRERRGLVARDPLDCLVEFVAQIRFVAGGDGESRRRVGGERTLARLRHESQVTVQRGRIDVMACLFDDVGTVDAAQDHQLGVRSA